MKKKACLILIFLLLVPFLLTACADSTNATKISFSGAVDFETIKALDGQKVSIVGYMATLSPVNGKFMYLMNLPYQSCPFCKVNTTQLSNTLAVYAPNGKRFEFTDQAINVTGKIEVGDFTDEYGYQYNYRIVDATYTVVDLKSAENERLALWYSVASDGLVAEVNTMFDYLYFLVAWPDYYVLNDDGSIAYYLYPSDVKHYLEDDGVYGYATEYADAYFPSLISRAKAINEAGLSDLIDLLTQAKEVEQSALDELNAEAYTYRVAEDLDGNEKRFTLNKTKELNDAFQTVYDKYLEWIASWEV